MKITVYIRTTEPYSQSLVNFLLSKHVTFARYDVSLDEKAFTEMVSISGQKRVPVTVIGDHVILGFDEEQIADLLEQATRDEN